MCARITFSRDGRKDIVILKPSEVEIESSWKILTDTAIIRLPRNVKYFDKFKVREVFKRGDRVKIELGYDGVLTTEFTGYITEVSASIPIEIKCQDEMFKVKQLPVNFSAKSIQLEKLLKQIIPGYQIDAMEGLELGTVRFAKTTVGEVLDKLNSELKIYTYIEPNTKTIVSGKIYADNSDQNIVNFNLERNAVSNDLQYRNREDITVKVNGSCISKGVKIEYSYGDNNADKNIEWQFSVRTKPELEIQVKRFYEANKRDGFDGSFTAFGIPRVQHGWKVNLKSYIYPDRDGIYYVESVTKTFKKAEYRQQIKLGNRYGQNATR